MTLQRRTLLRATASTATIAALAGCEALQGDDPEDGDATPTETDTPTATPDGEETTEVDRDELEAEARAFLDLLAAREFEAAQSEVAPRVQSQITPEQLEQVWNQLTVAYGQYVRVDDIEHSTSDQGNPVVVLTGAFESGRQPFRFTFADGELVGFLVPPGGETDAWAAPDYVDESAVEEDERQVAATDECSLGATLSLPSGDGPVPGVVLVHGSGAHDRDETVGPNKPFKDLAWGLASQGIAVLRYDKRTAACDVDLANAAIDGVMTDDAVAAVETLRAEDRVRDDAVFVVGHSIGGTLAPRIAARDPDLAGAVMLAPLGRPVPAAMLDQNEYLLTVDGELSAEEERLAEIEAMVEQIRSLDIADDEVVYLGGREYWRTLTAYDATAAAADLDRPMYLAFGGRDWQVTVEDDRPLWRDALADREDVTFATYDDLNHFLIPGEGQPTQAEYFEEGHVAERVIADVADWIDEVARAGSN